ncbi:MAG: hypothetical protein IPI67_41140 [Myxococcales bacterium]|nr:hypothetical protein [Myxococcales bacterium]
MRRAIGILTFSAVMFGGSAAFAQAQTFGKSGTFAFGAERLFAFYKQKVSFEAPNGNEDDYSSSGLGFGWGAESYPFNVPRLGFDYFVIDQLSIGGALAYASYDVDDNGPGGSGDAFLFAPRVGYFIGFTDVFGFWPRGGFTYHSLDPDGGNNNRWGLALTLEANFTIAPTEHFAFMVGPTFDIDFMGKTECGGPNNSDDCKLRYRSFGIQVGLLGWF